MRQGRVYLIKSESQGAAKVGFCAGPAIERLHKLRTGNPAQLDLSYDIPGTPQVESAIQAELKNYRIRGEWYRDVVLLEAIFDDLNEATHDADDSEILISPERASQIVRRSIQDNSGTVSARPDSLPSTERN